MPTVAVLPRVAVVPRVRSLTTGSFLVAQFDCSQQPFVALGTVPFEVNISNFICSTVVRMLGLGWVVIFVFRVG